MRYHHVVAEATIDAGAQCPWSGTEMFVVGFAYRASTATDPREHDPLGSDRDPLSCGAEGYDLSGDLMAQRER